MAMVNRAAFDALPKTYQAIFRGGCHMANEIMMARYDALNPAALRRLVANGAKLHSFPKDVMQASHKAAFELYEAEAASNPNLKPVYESWKPFRKEQLDWFKVCELNYDVFNITAG